MGNLWSGNIALAALGAASAMIPVHAAASPLATSLGTDDVVGLRTL
jgi:hypothetical protein